MLIAHLKLRYVLELKLWDLYNLTDLHWNQVFVEYNFYIFLMEHVNLEIQVIAAVSETNPVMAVFEITFIVLSSKGNTPMPVFPWTSTQITIAM